MNNRILILYAHPDTRHSRVNRILIEHARRVEGVNVNDLYEQYPDMLIHVKKEQRLLLDHDLIILQHPIYWYGGPAIIKEWIDRVLEYGFAYGDGGTALYGKGMMSVVSAGGAMQAYTPDGYHGYALETFLRPFERTAFVCGMQYHKPWVMYESTVAELSAVEAHGRAYESFLQDYRRLGNAVFQRETTHDK